MTQVDAKRGNPAALISLIVGIAAIPSFVFLGPHVVTWIVALAAIFAGASGVRRARRGAGGLVLSIVGIVLGSFMLLMAVILTAMFLTRPFR